MGQWSFVQYWLIKKKEKTKQTMLMLIVEDDEEEEKGKEIGTAKVDQIAV